MDKVPITREFCLDYIIEALSIGDPIVHRIFEKVSEGKWVHFCNYAETAEIVYQHCIKHDK